MIFLCGIVSTDLVSIHDENKILAKTSEYFSENKIATSLNYLVKD